MRPISQRGRWSPPEAKAQRGGELPFVLRRCPPEAGIPEPFRSWRELKPPPEAKALRCGQALSVPCLCLPREEVASPSVRFLKASPPEA